MFVDASAIVAILVREDDADELAARLGAARRRLTSAIAVYEVVTALARLRQGPVERARIIVGDFLDRNAIAHVNIGPAEEIVALDAFDRYGKGRHPARLNMGDCFAYACAKTNGVPLLFKGDDFAQTDIAVA